VSQPAGRIAQGAGRAMRPRHWWWRIGLILLAAAAALAPLPPDWVERFYSMRVYPAIQGVLTPISNQAPFAFFDVLICATAGLVVVSVVVDIARRRALSRVLMNLVLRSAIAAAGFYLVFLMVWGLNYRRQPLIDKLQFNPRRVSTDAARAASMASIEQLNALHDRAYAAGWPPLGAIDPALASGFRRATADLGLDPAAAARPKVSLLDLYFRRAGVDGMTAPYFLETLVQRELLPFERPAIVAHEWAHLAGFADESEASFVGWLTCLRGSAATQYSGWLSLYSHLLRTLGPRDRSAMSRLLAPGPRADLQAVAARYHEEVNPKVSAAGWRVYDGYLKANRVEAGAASYDLVVRLVLGVEYAPNWVPLRVDHQ
jgi:hypothetical protein